MHSAVNGSEFATASGMLIRVTSRPLSRIVVSEPSPADFQTIGLVPKAQFS
jgi:hypothetical protein